MFVIFAVLDNKFSNVENNCYIASALASAACWHFLKNLVEEDDKEDCCDEVPIHGNFRLLFGLLTPCYVVELVPRLF